jgi:hypothetical protein
MQRNMFLRRFETGKSTWLIAPYESFTVFATALRERSDLRNFLTACQSPNRIPGQ